MFYICFVPSFSFNILSYFSLFLPSQSLISLIYIFLISLLFICLSRISLFLQLKKTFFLCTIIIKNKLIFTLIKCDFASFFCFSFCFSFIPSLPLALFLPP